MKAIFSPPTVGWLTGLTLLLMFCFPPWRLGTQAASLRVGYGTPLGPRLSAVMAATPQCTIEIRKAEERLAQQTAAWKEYRRQLDSYQEDVSHAQATLRDMAARGLDPRKFNADGTRYDPRQAEPPAGAIPAFAPSEPLGPTPEDATHELAEARINCNERAALNLAGAHIDFVTLAYEVTGLLMLSGLALLPSLLHRPRKADLAP